MSSYLREAEVILEEVIRVAAAEAKYSGFCIGNTSKIDSTGLFFSPTRNTDHLVAGSVIVYLPHQAAEIARLADGRVDYILVDAEKKVGPEPDYYGSEDAGNIERAVRQVIRKSRLLTYKGNDLTVESIDCLLTHTIDDPVRGIGGKKVAIIGAGNLGSKLALKLVERAADVTITRRDRQKLDAIVSALNYIKPFHTQARVEGTTDNEAASDGAEVLIGITNGVPVITQSMVDRVAPNCILMDGGKGCLFREAIERAEERNLTVLRVDVRAGFAGQVAILLETERIVRTSIGRREVEGIHLVSAGLLGRKNEIIVDDVHNPRVVYGTANGLGDFVRSLSREQEEQMRSVRMMIGGRTTD